MFVVFVADSGGQHPGFKASFSSQIVETPNGEFHSSLQWLIAKIVFKNIDCFIIRIFMEQNKWFSFYLVSILKDLILLTILCRPLSCLLLNMGFGREGQEGPWPPFDFHT